MKYSIFLVLLAITYESYAQTHFKPVYRPITPSYDSKLLQNTYEKLEQKANINIETATSFLDKIQQWEVPKNCAIYKENLIFDIKKAMNKYLEEVHGWVGASDIANIMNDAYLKSPYLEQIETQIELNNLFNKQYQHGELKEEVDTICNVIIPILCNLKVSNIESCCYDLIMALSLEGYVKGSNNYLGITQEESIRAIKRENFLHLPAKYISIHDFTLDYYDLYIKPNEPVYEDNLMTRNCKQLIKQYYEKKVIESIVNM